MKRRGISNIITDNDITLTGTKNLGKSLSTVMRENDERMESFEQNIKFLYEHGGVGGGSGSGGGGGSSTKWKLKAELGNTECVSGGTVGLQNGAGSYILHIWTSGGSGTYSVTYSYGTQAPQIVTLNAGNAWSTSIKVNLLENGVLSVSATDGSISRQITGVSYIVEPFKFNAPVVTSSADVNYASDIFVEDASTLGVFLKSRNYAYAVDGTYTYEWYYDNALISSGTITESSGSLVCDITSYMTNENAAAHFYKLKVYALVGSNLEPTIIEYNGSFNLIPTTLFLKLAPADGEIFYDDTSVANPYVYGINKVISLQARVYKGKNATNEPGTLSWTTYENGVAVQTDQFESIRDGRTYNPTIYFSTVGWNYVTFNYSLGGEPGTPVTKYFYCESVDTNYDWYVEGHLPNDRRCYVAQEFKQQLTKLQGISWSGLNPSNPPLYIQKLASDTNPTELSIETFTTGEQMINIGIQYNDINSSKDELIILYDTANKANQTIRIFQDKIIFGNQLYESDNECGIFLHKEREYSPNDRSKYHLLTICMAHTGTMDGNNNPYYEVSVYFDGVLEGAVTTKAITTRQIFKADLMPANYAINQFEISSWSLERGTRKLNDSDINWYWNSYKSRTDRSASLTAEDTLILNSLFDANNNNNPTYSIENELVKVPAGFPATVANNVAVPTLVLSCPREIQYGEGRTASIYTWLNKKYVPDSDDPLLPVQVATTVYYSPGRAVLSEIKVPEAFGTGNDFTISVQGSSTVGNKSKNFTLRLNSSESTTAAGETILFSPNYDKDDPDTFLPEQAFTLKADVVDSSHTNNTAIGKFVNENNNWNYGGNFSGDEKIIDHVKQCLEGFATLVFLNVNYRESDIDHTDTYYLGIYNFNLGRDSYFNLGYCDLSQLHVQTFEEQTDSYFKFCRVGGANERGINPVSGFIAAEVQDNSPYWDFSQYDLSILFPINSSEKSNFMFGDLVYPAGEGSIVQNRIRDFVKSVAAAGGYIFDRFGKTFRDNNDENGGVGKYNIPNTVSDFKIQHVRTDDNGNPLYTSYTGDIQSVNETSLLTCIVDDDENETYSKLNYDSAVYYYTTCMVFGLIDSVQKNLNIKTWNATNPDRCQMGLYFYDMDTCLGKDNSGHDVSYFAFSDFWKSNITKYDSSGNVIPADDELTPVARVVNEGCDILRDCFLPDSGVKGYDTASSYLFAIAKYAKAVLGSLETNVFPQQIYAQWRNFDGPLTNADKFIDTYFTSNFNGIPECLINLNYRNKYLYDYAENDPSLVKASSFHGRGIEYTRDWLSGRLHILDAYFNLGAASIEIVPGISEPKHNISISENSDVYILSDIFTNEVGGAIHRDNAFSFVVSADDYSPLFVRLGNSYRWYLFEKSDINYETYIPIQAQLTTFGGSQLWRTLNTVNGFVSTMTPSENFVFNSKIIDSIVGTSGTHTGNWLLNAPSVKTITLTSPNYSGTLSITNQFPSLSTININNSSISLIVDESGISQGGITTVNASNLRNASQLTLENCSKLTNCNLANSRIGTCVISPTWSDSINFSNVYARILKLSARNLGNLTINGNSTVNDLQFSNMETVYINNCANLTTIKCTDTSRTPLKSLTINNCVNLTNLEIVADSTLEVLNLYNCSNLRSITIKNPTGTSYPNLRILNFGYTSITTINYDLNGTTSQATNGDFDFRTIFPNVGIGGNSSTSYINFVNSSVRDLWFRNDPSHPVYLWYNFAHSNIRRLYGTFRVMGVPSLFSRCSNFSIHGTNLATAKWAGVDILSSGRIKHPTEIRPSDADTYCNSDSNTTNLIFDSSFTYMGDTYDYGTFANTSCTIFDMYYVLYRLPSTTTSIAYGFYNTSGTYSKFSWTASVDNSPNRLMFAKCGNVTNAYSLAPGSGLIRLYSPDHNEYDEITSNNGLFSPLTNIQNVSSIFTGYTVVADRFLFRRTTSNYQITSFSDFGIARMVDNVNTIAFGNADSFGHYVTYLNNNGLDITEKFGNLDGFFTNLPSVGEMYGFLNLEYINFSTISHIPDATYKIIMSFRSSYGTGEINLYDYFTANTTLSTLGHSFRVNDIYNGDRPSFELSNDTFGRFVPRSGYAGLRLIVNADSSEGSAWYLSGDKRDNCFGGVIRKYISGNTFPFDIFYGLTNLEKAEGVFQNAEGNIENLKLPGTLFENNSQLRSCRACFYNIQIPYTISPTHDITYVRDTNGTASVADDVCQVVITESELTAPNFIHCTNLQNVSMLFGAEVGSGIDTDMPKLSGSIPKNLFWHGMSELRVVEFVGANERTQNVDPETDRPIPNSYTYTQLRDSIMRIVPNATITDMTGCFQHSNLSPYINNFTSVVNMPNAIEDNPDYSPFYWNYDSSRNRYVENSARNLNKQTIIWHYDGINKPTSGLENVEQLDTVDWNEQCTYQGSVVSRYIAKASEWQASNDVLPTATNNYIAPPDLLRFCTPTCQIDMLFYQSGILPMNSGYYVGASRNKYLYGLKGRLCPYMLKPVKNITSTKQMFTACKCISWVFDRLNEKEYWIPEDFFKYANKVTDLSTMFAHTIQPHKSDLESIFVKLGNTNNILNSSELKINEIFKFCYWSGVSDSDRTRLENAFVHNRIASLTDCFRVRNSAVDSSEYAPSAQWVTFSNMFPTSGVAYNSSLYDSDPKFRTAFYGFTTGYVVFEPPQTLCSSVNNSNYGTTPYDSL